MAKYGVRAERVSAQAAKSRSGKPSTLPKLTDRSNTMNKAISITGASSGIGKATAKLFQTIAVTRPFKLR